MSHKPPIVPEELDPAAPLVELCTELELAAVGKFPVDDEVGKLPVDELGDVEVGKLPVELLDGAPPAPDEAPGNSPLELCEALDAIESLELTCAPPWAAEELVDPPLPAGPRTMMDGVPLAQATGIERQAKTAPTGSRRSAPSADA